MRHGSDSMNDDGGEALGVSINNLNAAVAPRGKIKMNNMHFLYLWMILDIFSNNSSISILGFCLDFHQEPCHF